MNLEIRHLRTIQSVSREGNVSKAAKHLCVTQSALSHQLREIEGRVGSPVFRRAQRRMHLTPVGEEMLKLAESIITQMDRAEESLKKQAAGETGKIRFSTQCYTCYHWLPDMLSQFQKQFPNVDVQVDVSATRAPLEFIERGALDLAIMYDAPNDPRFGNFPLFEDEMVVAVAPTHPWAGKKVVDPKALETMPLYLYNVPEKQSYLTKFVFGPLGIFPEKVYHLQLTEGILEFVKAGAGVTILAKWAIAPQLRDRSLKAVRLSRAGFFRTWYAVIPANSPKYVHTFISMLQRLTQKSARLKKK